MSNPNALNIPSTPFVDLKTGYVKTEWLQWMINPHVYSIQPGTPINAAGGGTGSDIAPAQDQIAVGDGAGYVPTTTLPDAAFPAVTGDIGIPVGTTTATLVTVNANLGPFGDGTHVSRVTLNAKGLTTAASAVNITGSPGDFAAGGNLTTVVAITAGTSVTATTGFGCNGKPPQVAASLGAAAPTTAATNVAPFGYTTAVQADRIISLLNSIRSALIANGIAV